jgi:hypothetical protein
MRKIFSAESVNPLNDLAGRFTRFHLRFKTHFQQATRSVIEPVGHYTNTTKNLLQKVFAIAVKTPFSGHQPLRNFSCIGISERADAGGPEQKEHGENGGKGSTCG